MAHRILLIDDEEAILEVFSIFLTNHKYIVDCARNVAEAYESCQQNRYAAVISDLSFESGRMSGLGMIEKLATQEPKPKIIVCSGFATRDIQDQALLKGADLFFAKPFTFLSVIEKLECLLSTPPVVDSIQKKAAAAVLVQHDDDTRRAAFPF